MPIKKLLLSCVLLGVTSLSASVTLPVIRDGAFEYRTVSDYSLDLWEELDAASWRSVLGLTIGEDVLSPSGDGSALTGLLWSQVGVTPTTLSGYGITDAQPLDGDLTAIAGLTTTPYGRSLLETSNAAGLRTLAGLGSTDVVQFEAIQISDDWGIFSNGNSNGDLTVNQGMFGANFVFGWGVNEVRATNSPYVDGNSIMNAEASDARYIQRTDQRYPMFLLTVPYGAPWTDFELKASRTNFTGTPSMVYYYHSPGSTGGSEIGTLPSVWYTDSGATDRREWLKQPTSPRSSIAAELSDINSEVGGIVVIVTDPDVEYLSGADDLVWSYSWTDGSTTDDDPAGRSIWRPIVPVQWVPADWNP